jgi:hypothetical protein
MEKYKKILEKKELYIQFSDEEMSEIGWEEGQKLSLSFDKVTGSIFLKPYVKVDVDMSEWSREVLEYIVGVSCEKDISCNQVIEDVLKDTIKTRDTLNKKEELLCE